MDILVCGYNYRRGKMAFFGEVNDGRLASVGYFVSISLDVLGENYAWLAQCTGLDENVLRDFGFGRKIPSDDLFSIISQALNSPQRTVDELVIYLKDNSIREMRQV